MKAKSKTYIFETIIFIIMVLICLVADNKSDNPDVNKPNQLTNKTK